MNFTFEEASRYLPPSLAAADLRDLYKDLKKLDEGLRYYSPHAFDFYLQGDAFASVPFLIVKSESIGEKSTTAILLSNTCDVSDDNSHMEPPFVTVAPIIRVSRWRSGLLNLGVKENAIEEKLKAARAHKISSLFLLAQGQGIDEESLVLFQQIQSMPIQRFNVASPTRLATLSQAAHWVLTVKLSIHFCRLQEGVNRQAQ